MRIKLKYGDVRRHKGYGVFENIKWWTILVEFRDGRAAAFLSRTKPTAKQLRQCVKETKRGHEQHYK